MWKIIAIMFVCFFTSIYSQDVSIGERKMLVKFTGSFYKANMLNSKTGHNYLGGNLELYFNDKYSVRGDIYTLIGEVNAVDYSMRNTTQLNVGFNRNFTKKRFSPFIGVYTGVSKMMLRSLLESFAPDLTHPTIQYVPLVGLNVGFQYYFHKNFHFFMDARYTHQVNPFKASLMDEINYSAGLGFQLSVKKK